MKENQLENSRLPRVEFHDLSIAIETYAGELRRGPGWINKLPADYGFIDGTEGADGDEMDCYLGPNPESTIIYVVDQNDMNGSGSFDEHKCFLGYRSAFEAKKDYYKGHSHGYAIFRSITALSLGAFKTWLKYGDTSSPLSKIRTFRPFSMIRHKNYKFTTRKLTPDQVALVRHSPHTQKRELAEKFGVAYSTIHNIKSYKTFMDEAG